MSARLECLTANQRLQSEGLVHLTWGNVSVRYGDGFVIKPSGVAYQDLQADDLVEIDLASGNSRGRLRPSTDTPTHLALYRAHPEIEAVVHVHSTCATAFAQSRRPIPCLGTTHADHFAGSIELTRPLDEAEMADYETNTGRVIVEHLADRSHGVLEVPAVLVPGHGPFVWGGGARSAVDNAVALEACAEMALMSAGLGPLTPLEPWVLATHHERKHGPGAYYGQRVDGDTKGDGA